MISHHSQVYFANTKYRQKIIDKMSTVIDKISKR